MKTHKIRSTWKNAVAGLLLTLSAAGFLEAASPALHIAREGTNVVVNFTGRLQTTERVEGPYASIAGALSPHVETVADASPQFWRSVLSDVRSIAAGDRFTLAVRNDGTLWAWGANEYGQLGIGTTNSIIEPVQVGNDANWLTVSEGAGALHSLAIRDDGTLWAWGDNRFGQLGLGHTNDVLDPVQMGTNANWESVAAGWRHSMALRTDGTLWAWGENRFGQLGIGTTNSAFEPIQVGTDANWQAMSVSLGDPQRTDPYYGDRRYSHTLGLRTDGTLWAWGNNQTGQLGLGTQATDPPYGVTQPTRIGTDTDWRSVSAGGFHGAAIRADGTLWVWGYTYLALGYATNQPAQLRTNVDWQSVSAGGFHSMAVRVDGTLWAWGDDNAGQLGVGTSANEYGTRYPTAPGSAPWLVGTNANWISVASGEYHTVVLRDDGTIWTWGGGGLGRTVIGYALNVQVGSSTNWLTVDAGHDFTVALRDDGTLWSWGWNEAGLLGIGTIADVNQPTQIGTNANWQSVDAGNIHAIAIQADGTLWTWGRGRPSPTQVGTNTNWRSASASGASVEIPYDQRHIVALREDGTLWTWGSNGEGQLGIGDVATNLPNISIEPMQVGTSTNWVAVSAGWMHTMAIRDDGTLWGWGLNGPGSLGIGESIYRTNQPVQVGTDTNWAAVSGLRLHTRAVRTDGTFWMWGRGSETGFSTNAYEPVQVGSATDWKVVPTDDASFYQQGSKPTSPSRSSAYGWRHSVGILHDGTLWASGYNFVGQLAQPVGWIPYPVAGDDWGVQNE